MPNKELGIADPVYDALRIRSGQSIAPDLGSGIPPGGGSGLENKIYLWHADGSAIDIFDPTQTGLIAALAGAVSGDTVWRPSIPIAITTGITVPAGVALVGISDKAIINASGFNGTAITLGIGARLFGGVLNYTSNGTTAIGVNAQAASTQVQHVEINVDGGSTKNVRILTGAPLVSSVIEIWTIAESFGILWAPYVASPAWNTIALPANFSKSEKASEYATALQTDHLGHYLYVCGHDLGNGGRVTVWQLTNLAAIRAAPATAPSWSVIAYDGETVSAGTLDTTFSGSFYMRCFGDSLYLRAMGTGGTLILGIYNGVTWSWTNGPGMNLNYQAVNGGKCSCWSKCAS